MKATKRILALLTAALLALSLTGCLVSKDEAGTDDPAAANTTDAANAPDAATDKPSGNAGDSSFDREAVAIELGDVQIKAGEISDVFDQYIGLFGYSGTVDGETVSQCLDMTLDYTLRYYLPLWKANELGVTLTEADEAEIEAIARAEVDEERDGVLCQFAYYYGITEEYPEDPSAFTEDEMETIMDAINGELALMFYEGFTFEQYLDQQLETYRTGARIDRLSAILQEQTEKDLVADAETIDAWYAETLEKQKTSFEASPAEYRYVAEDFASGETKTPALYVPAGFARIRVVQRIPDGDPDTQMDLNTASMKRLEAEYGALVLKGEDEARQAEIRTEYAALKEENDKLEATYYAEVKKDVEAAYADFANGATFESVMDRYNVHEAGESGMDERLIYIGGADTRYGDLAAEAAKLNPGEISGVLLIDGGYYLIQMVEILPEGVVDRDSIAEEINAAATAATREDAWEAQFDSWLTEAKAIAVYHPETYESIGKTYLN